MRHKITVKHDKLTAGIRLDKGMSVEVITHAYGNPITSNGGQAVSDAFMRIYGIDLKKAGALNVACLDWERLD